MCSSRILQGLPFQDVKVEMVKIPFLFLLAVVFFSFSGASTFSAGFDIFDF